MSKENKVKPRYTNEQLNKIVDLVRETHSAKPKDEMKKAEEELAELRAENTKLKSALAVGVEALKKSRSFISKEGVNSGAAPWYVDKCAKLRFQCDEALSTMRKALEEKK
jgi:hypothetical protein